MISAAARSLFQSKKIHMSALSDEQLADEIECCVQGTPWHSQLDNEINRRLKIAEQDYIQAMYA